jgi:hypothetical protein
VTCRAWSSERCDHERRTGVPVRLSIGQLPEMITVASKIALLRWLDLEHGRQKCRTRFRGRAGWGPFRVESDPDRGATVHLVSRAKFATWWRIRDSRRPPRRRRTYRAEALVDPSK